MIQKTIRQNVEIAASVAEIVELNGRLLKDSEAFGFAYSLLSTEIQSKNSVVESKKPVVDWKELSLLNYDDRDRQISFADTRMVSIDEKDYERVLGDYLNQPGVERVKFAYLTRLVLLYARRYLRKERKVDISVSSFDSSNFSGVELLRRVNEKAARCILAGNLEAVQRFIEDN